MRRIPEHLATGLDVRNSVEVDRLELTQGLTVFAGEHPVAYGSAVILTPPVPQLLGLLRASELRPESKVAALLETVNYNPSLTVMATLDAPAGLPQGHLAQPSPDVAWLADNQHKGTSEIPAITIHSTADFARVHLDDEPEAWAQQLIAQAAPHLGGGIVAAKPHRWRYAEPQTTFDMGAVTIDRATPVVLAGEVFAGAKIEGAFLSGLAAADAVLNLL
jgi:predicted NAD/FAD-dependent oxidoreductase